QFAEDLEHFLENKPVTARPVNWIERGLRWCRRNPAVASLTAAVFLAMVIGTTVSVVLAVWANSNREQAEENERTANLHAKDAIKARNDLAKEKDELELTVARSLLRPLALDLKESTPLTDPEIDALWELAGKRGTGIGYKFAEDATANTVS